MKLTLNRKVFLDKFITPVSKVSDQCIISIYPDHIQTLVTTKSTNPIVYANVKVNSDLDGKDSLTLNIPDINKLSRILKCLDSEDVIFDVNSNNIEYKSKTMNFKYHLLDDGIIEETPVKLDKIKQLQTNCSFNIDHDIVKDIMKGTTFASDSDKLYFYTKDGKVYAELTDKNVSNMDSVSYLISDNYDGDEFKNDIIIMLEIFKMFYGITGRIITKINTKLKMMIFKFEDTDYTLQYIVAPITR